MTLAIEDVIEPNYSHSYEDVGRALVKTIKSYGFTVIVDTDKLRELAPIGQLDQRVIVPAGVPGEFFDRERGGPGGLTYHSGKIVAIRDDLSPFDQVRVLSHELAHVILHGRLSQEVPELTKLENLLVILSGEGAITIKGEAAAELSSFMILSLYGMANASVSDNYISHFLGQLNPFFRRPVNDEIAKEASRLIVDVMPKIDRHLRKQ